jgi:hypothetical protein
MDSLQASADCALTSKPDYMFLDRFHCVETALSCSPLPIPLSVVTDIYRLMEMTDAEFEHEPLTDVKPHYLEALFPRPIRPLGISRSGPVLTAVQEHSEARELQELCFSTISESSPADTAELSEALNNTDCSRLASPDETCSLVTPPSPTFVPFSPVIDEESCCMWSSAGTSRTYHAFGVAFSALGFVCPDLEQMAESSGDFQGRHYDNNCAQGQLPSALAMDLAC